MHIEKGFEPLGKLKIILILAFYQFLNFDMFFVTSFIKCSLQYFIVVHIVVSLFSLPFNLAESDLFRVDYIEELAVDGSTSQFLNFL